MPTPSESPKDAQRTIQDTLSAQSVTEFSVELLGVDVTGYRFTVGCEESDDNWATMNNVFGTMNTRKPSRVEQSRSLADAAQVWRIAGAEGRFAKENPPPPDAI